MSNLSVSQLLAYVRVQMAAEALYYRDARNQTDAGGNLLTPGDILSGTKGVGTKGVRDNCPLTP